MASHLGNHFIFYSSLNIISYLLHTVQVGIQKFLPPDLNTCFSAFFPVLYKKYTSTKLICLAFPKNALLFSASLSQGKPTLLENFQTPTILRIHFEFLTLQFLLAQSDVSVLPLTSKKILFIIPHCPIG